MKQQIETELGAFSGSVYITFLPTVLPGTPEVTPEVKAHEALGAGGTSTKLALSRHQVEILHKCCEDSMLVDIMAITGRSDHTKFRHQVLNPLLEAGLIEMTIPDKPRSSKQKYRLSLRPPQRDSLEILPCVCEIVSLDLSACGHAQAGMDGDWQLGMTRRLFSEGVHEKFAQSRFDTIRFSTFKDAGFADDSVKTNTVQILRQAGIDDVKSL